MFAAAPPEAGKPKRIQLPRTSTRNQTFYDHGVYCKIVREIVPSGPFGACLFEGSIHKPGAVLDAEELPSPAVVIECAGQQGVWQRGKKRDYLYILWRYDSARSDWIEVARALARDASWTAVLKEAVWRTLHPHPELADVAARSRDVADELVEAIDQRLRVERPDVRKSVMHQVYERMAGKIAECA